MPGPVRVGPYQRIVGIYWPTDEDLSLPKYVISGIELVYRWTSVLGSQGDDGIEYPEAEPQSAGGYISEMRWEIPSFRNEKYFTTLFVYDGLGQLLDSGSASYLGATLVKPTIPYASSFGAWSVWNGNEADSSNHARWDTANVSGADPLFPGFRGGNAVAYVNAMGIAGAPEKRWPGSGDRTGWAEYAPSTSRSRQHEYDVTPASVVIGSTTFYPIGVRTSIYTGEGAFLSYLLADVLFKSSTPTA